MDMDHEGHKRTYCLYSFLKSFEQLKEVKGHRPWGPYMNDCLYSSSSIP